METFTRTTTRRNEASDAGGRIGRVRPFAAFALCLALAAIGLAVLPAAATSQELRMDNLSQDLSRRFASVDPPSAAFFAKAGVESERVPTPFLIDGGIARVIDRGVRIARPFYVGFAGKDFVVRLSGNREGMAQLCSRAGFNADSDSNRAAFLSTMLVATARQAWRFFLLSSADEIRPRPNLSPEQAQVFSHALANMRSVVHPPAMKASGDGWIGEAFALEDSTVMRYAVKLSPTGAFSVAESVVQRDLLVPLVIH
jgi:hypothetical protein